MRRALPVLLIPAALVAQAPPPTAAAAPEADHGQVKKLLIAMRFSDQIKAGFLQALEAQQAKADTLPPGFLDAFKAAFDVDDFVDQIVPIFAKRMTQAEVEAALRFYGSPEGASFAAKQATLAPELQKVGERYGMALALKVMQAQLKEDGAK
ncbi:MAG TPA: DUF2059 domain-containing protein [Holophagaceae bacterium]|nr:DUF2059 domain-containing protein [Holophagaceae bacterium]